MTGGPPADGAPDPGFSMSAGLVARLKSLDIGLAVTSYQSGLLYLIGRNPGTGGLNVHQTPILRPMGLAVAPDGSLVLAAGFHLIRFVNALEPNQRANDIFDACYLPRTVHITGELDAHDVGLDAAGRSIFVNTRFNCLATVSDLYSFAEIWRPPFVSALVDEDRCHLNGLAMQDGEPAYATAVSRSDTIDGWRDRRADGGVVIDVKTGDVVCGGLSMPHSPRLHRGRLWLLNSGTGELGFVELPNDGGMGRFEPVAFCPGFLRGLAFSGRYAFVGLSRPRYNRFEGLALEARLEAARFGAVVRRAGHRPGEGKLRRLVPYRRPGGRTLRPCGDPRRRLPDGGEPGLARRGERRQPRAGRWTAAIATERFSCRGWRAGPGPPIAKAATKRERS